MLSTENPSSDPSCSYQIPPLNPNSDERASSHLDLPKAHHPNFSIRDYVFTARSKDIKKNWPFSLKNLQLCLRHGVKELLPPLKLPKRCTVDTRLVEKDKTVNYTALNVNTDDPQLINKVVESGDENENGFPSTTTSVSHSEIESLTVNRVSTSQIETNRRPNKTTENTGRPLSKKCRLVVKFGGNSDRASTEDIASPSTTASETMASKVCPVCKTFSSSSNTTLNAHIDQCLSVGSTPTWASDSKQIKHRIKPRKTRLMVDVYTTALPCTLEELDRRNGTSWAAISCSPTKEVEKTGSNAETADEGKKTRVSQVHPEDIGDIGPVYIDANGTKIRMLSKFDDQPSEREDIEARKPQKGDRGGKVIWKRKKKKRLAQKYQKFLKLAPQSKMKFASKAHGSQIVEEDCEGEAKSTKKEHEMSNKTKPNDSVTLKPWVCSKRRGFPKKTSQEGHQPMRCSWPSPQDLPAYDDQPLSRDTRIDRKVVQKSAYLSQNSTSSAAENDRREKPFGNVPVSKINEQSLGRKKMRNFSVAAGTSGNSGCSPVKPTSVQLRNCVSPLNNLSLLRKRTLDACGAANSSDSSSFASTKLSREGNANRSQRLQLSSSQKKMCVKKLSALEKSRKDPEYDSMNFNVENWNGSDEVADESLERSPVLQPGQGRGTEDHDSVDDIVAQFSSERGNARTMKSLDSEIYELRFSLNAQPDDSLQSAEDYRRLLCGTEAPPTQTEPERNMLSGIEEGDGSHLVPELDSQDGSGHSFPEVDPIPIPGPPGSFLPSPRDMGSEDFQGNSSLTTSRVHSSLEQHDVVDGDSSGSPISAASTISNSTPERCNFKFSEPLPSVGPCDKIQPAASVESSLQSAETGRTAFEGGYLRPDRIYGDKRSISFENDQPCCCQRKERLSQAAALNFQESQLLRRRNLASMTIPTGGKPMDFNPNLRSVNSCEASESAKPSGYLDLGRENTVLPVTKPHSGSGSVSGSVSPSASNPVLRLMGKNLLVVNKEDDTPVAVGGVQQYIQNNPNTSQLPDFTKVSTGNIHFAPQASVIFGHDPREPVAGQYYESGFLSNRFRSRSDSRSPLNAQLPAGMFQDQHTGYGFEAWFQQARNSVKEVIVIDDAPESENNVIPTASRYNSAHPFSCYQAQEHQQHNARSYHTSPSNPGPVRWGHIPGSSGVIQQGPFRAASSASSSSPGHIRAAALHYPPGFS